MIDKKNLKLAGPRPRFVRSIDDASAGSPEENMPNLDSVTGYLLRRSHYLYCTYWLANFKSQGSLMTPMQSGMLTILRQYPESTQTELARRMGIEVPTAFKALKRLEEAGYIERIADKPDKRARTLRLTARGIDILREIDAFNPVRDADLLADFTPAERVQFAQLLTKLIVRGTAHLGLSQDVVSSHPSAALTTDEEGAS